MLYSVSQVLDTFEKDFDTLNFDFKVQVPGIAATGNLTRYVSTSSIVLMMESWSNH